MYDPLADRPGRPRPGGMPGVALVTVFVMLPAAAHSATDIRQSPSAMLKSGESFDVSFRPLRLAIHVNRDEVEASEEDAGSSDDGTSDGSGGDEASEPGDSNGEASSSESS